MESKAEISLRERWRIIIFESDTYAGKLFDVILLIAILLSVVAVMLESVGSIKADHGELLYIIEWVFTVIFTIEYVARIIIIDKPWKYITSFFGLIDLLSIIPTYLGLILVGAHSLLVIRSIRLLRVFRVLKMMRFLGEASYLTGALRASRAKITVFIGAVFVTVVILGTLMYMIEGPEHGFTSIPRSIYWAVVTLTTVGYGDIAPGTVIGQGLATLIMILGYGMIAVPTGIVSAEMSHQRNKLTSLTCESCHRTDHDTDAHFCKHCGGKLINKSAV